MIHDNLKCPEAILGLDPGRDKIGFAFASRTSGELYCSGRLGGIGNRSWREFLDVLECEREPGQSLAQDDGIIVNLNKFAAWLIEPLSPNIEPRVKICVLALGNGTFSEALEKDIRALECSRLIKIKIIDEYGTTLEARKLYWRIHRPSLLRRLLPRVLWGNLRPLDDLAAWAIARRML